METIKKLSISLLNEMLTTVSNTRLFSESKISYLDPSLSVLHGIEHNEYMQQKHRCEVKINQIEACITWLKSIQNEDYNPTKTTETKTH